MLEIILFIAAITGIAALARGRGANPWLWATVAGVGYFVVLVAVVAILQEMRPSTILVARLPWPGMAAWSWVGLVAGYLRFFRGTGAVQPEGSWTCSECKWLNKSYAIFCEACKAPYRR